MASYKVGQRVKVIAVNPEAYNLEAHLIGKEGAIIKGTWRHFWANYTFDYGVKLDFDPNHPYGFDSCHLTPLDPTAAKLIEELTLKARHYEPTIA